MEPGHEDREYVSDGQVQSTGFWLPQWSPVMKTGNTGKILRGGLRATAASMEPGHEDREYALPSAGRAYLPMMPQWSPVMKTGNTRCPATWWTRTRPCLNGARS